MKTEVVSCSSAPDPAAELSCSCSSTSWWSVSSNQEPRRIESSWWHMERSREVLVLASVLERVNSVTSSRSNALRLPARRREGGGGGEYWRYSSNNFIHSYSTIYIQYIVSLSTFCEWQSLGNEPNQQKLLALCYPTLCYPIGKDRDVIQGSWCHTSIGIGTLYLCDLIFAKPLALAKFTHVCLILAKY